MPKLLLQAGHSSAYTPYDSNGGGAPGEADWTTRCAEYLHDLLTAAGVQVTLVGHWYGFTAPAEAHQDYDLFLALHYDADLSATQPGYDTGCFAGRAAKDPCGARADQFLGIFDGTYPQVVGIALHNERWDAAYPEVPYDASGTNLNVTEYYAFNDTTAKTPGVLVEAGVGMGLDHDILYDQMPLVAAALSHCVLQYLGLVAPPEPTPVPDPTPPTLPTEYDMLTDDQKAILDKMAQLNANAGSIDTWISRLGRSAEIGRTIVATKRVPAAIRPLADELTHMAD